MIIAGLQLRAWNVLVVKKIFSSVGSRDFQFVSSINRTMRMPHGFQYCATIIASGCNRHPPKRTRLANKRRNRDLCSVLIVKCKEQEIRTGSVPKFPTEISPPQLNATIQLPGRPCTSGKNMSCHEFGARLMMPRCAMNLAKVKTFCGVISKVEPGLLIRATVSSRLILSFE